MRKNRLIYHALPIVFLVIIFFPIINSGFHIFKDIETTENRALAEKPMINLGLLDVFPGQYEAYYDDHFEMRNRLQHYYSTLSLYGFKKSPLPEKAFVGLNGFLYMNKKELFIYRGTELYTKDELDKMHKKFKYRADYLKKRHIKYYAVIIPVKSTIYPEYIPSHIYKVNNYSKTDQLIERIKGIEGLTIIDLREALFKLKNNDTLLYYKTDNHWNELAAFYATQLINNEIRKDFENIPVLKKSSFNIEVSERKGGNIAKMIGMIEDFDDIEIKLKPIDSLLAYQTTEDKKRGYPIPKYFPYKWIYEVSMKTNNDALPSALVIRESFGNKIIPFLSRGFSKSEFIFDSWEYRFHEDMIENEQPDIYIQMSLEAFQDHMLDY